MKPGFTVYEAGHANGNQPTGCRALEPVVGATVGPVPGAPVNGSHIFAAVLVLWAVVFVAAAFWHTRGDDHRNPPGPPAP